MCRNIKTLFNVEPPATALEIRDEEAAKAKARSAARFSTPSAAGAAPPAR